MNNTFVEIDDRVFIQTADTPMWTNWAPIRAYLMYSYDEMSKTLSKILSNIRIEIFRYVVRRAWRQHNGQKKKVQNNKQWMIYV